MIAMLLALALSPAATLAAGWMLVVCSVIGGLRIADAMIVRAPIDEGRDVARRIAPITPPPQIPPPARCWLCDAEKRDGVTWHVVGCPIAEPPKTALEARVRAAHPRLLPVHR